MNTWQIFREGIRRSGQSWQVLVVLWLGELLPAFLLALLPALNLIEAARLTAFQETASGIPGWMGAELFASFSTWQQGLGFDLASMFNRSFFSTAVTWLLIVPPVAWLISSFLYGGTLGRYLRPGEDFQLHRFFSQCWRWWGKYLLLALVQVVTGLVILATGGFFFILGLSISPWLGVLVLILALLTLGWWLALFELSRVSLAARDDHSILQSLARSSSLLRRRPWLLLRYYLLSLLGLLAVNFIFRLGLFPVMPLTVWPLVLVLEQAFIILRIWLRAARYAGDAVLMTAP
jgi:hypothetical protein